MTFENSTLSQKIADSVALKIAQGDFKQGDRLLEQELTDFFGTSRAPIREAMYILEKEGIVERIPRKGVFVKRFTRKEVVDLYDVVYRLTEIALRRVMENIKAQDQAMLEQLVEQMEATLQTREIQKCYKLLAKLQMKFFELSDNQILKDMYQMLDKRLTPFRLTSLSHPSRLKESVAEYREIIDGIRTKSYNKIFLNLRVKERRALDVLAHVAASGKSDN